MTDVKEVEIDISEVRATQGDLYKEQLDAGMAYSPETVEVSKQALNDDLSNRMSNMKQNPDSPNPINPEAAQSGPEGVDQLADRTPEPPKRDERSPQEILEELGLKEDPKKRTITHPNGQSVEYIQKPLSFLGKMQFLSYIGEVLDKAMSGDNALQLNSLFEVPTRSDVLSADDFSDAQTFVQAVGKLLVYAPDFLGKCYCIWLRVPEYERDWAIEAMEESLTDEEGFDIIDTFIDQNWDTLQGFFSERVPKLRDRLQARYRASQSEQSKR